MKHRLDKESYPGWTFETRHEEHIRWMLEEHVCKLCKYTKDDYENEFNNYEPTDEFEEDHLSRNINPHTYSPFFPKNYTELSDEEKINLLLDTACGCEYYYRKEEEDAK